MEFVTRYGGQNSYRVRLSDKVQNDLEGHGPLTPYIIQNKRLPRYTFVPNLIILCQIFHQLSMHNQIASRTVHVSRTVQITWSVPNICIM